jgi:hypothetical protein
MLTEVELLLGQLSDYIDDLVKQAMSKPVNSEKELQLREINKAIERIESSGVPVPSSLLDEKSRLLDIVGSYRGYQNQALTIYNKLNALILQLQCFISTGNTTPWRVVAKAVIDILRQQRKQMQRTEICEAVFSMLQDRLLPGDFELAEHNGRPFWKNTVSRVLYNLRKENILKPALKHRYYELEEVYYENQTPFD